MSDLPTLEAADNLLANLERSSCTCKDCVAMCVHKPCWGTPEQIEGLLDSGVDPKLFMLDFWQAEPRIYMVQPAIVNHGGKDAPMWPTGRCVLLTEDSRCTVHDSGFKPVEGAVALCSIPVPAPKDPNNPHPAVAATWDTDKGRAIVERWKTAVGYAPRRVENPVIDLFEMIMGRLGELENAAYPEEEENHA